MSKTKKFKNDVLELKINKSNGQIELLDASRYIIQHQCYITDKTYNRRIFPILKYGIKNTQGFSFHDSLQILQALNVPVYESRRSQF